MQQTRWSSLIGVMALLLGLLVPGVPTHTDRSTAGTLPASRAEARTAVDPHVFGFSDVAKAVTPAVVNITPSKVLVQDRKGRHGRPGFSPEEFFGLPQPHNRLPLPEAPHEPPMPAWARAFSSRLTAIS